MCWVREWARAILNLEWAKIHCQRAHLKLEKRGNLEGEYEAARVIEALENLQGEIKTLMEKHGISRGGGKMIQEAMTGKRTVKGKVEAWVEKY